MKKSNIHKIDGDIFFEQIKSVLAEGESVRINVTGHSMDPTFKDGVDQIVISPFDPDSLSVGDVVMFDRGDTICVHRIVSRDADNLVIRGDGNSLNALERATVSDVIALVTGGTFRHGHEFTVNDRAWKANTVLMLKHARFYSAFHRVTRILKSYPLSILVSLVLVYLSMFDPSALKMTYIPHYDKWIHGLMYFGVSAVYWFEWIKVHRRNRKMTARGVVFCFAIPIIIGGVIEILQEFLTVSRSAEWMDFVSDIIGAAAGTAFTAAVTYPLMRRFKILILVAMILFPATASAAQPRVKPGIEVLQEMNFAPIAGKRVGLVTNPSGVDHNLRSTIDILSNAPEVNLVALYGPEHGVRGDVYAGGHVADFTDPVTGLPVYSLYGPTRKPTDDMLRGVDVMVYDIQDVGARCYTFISSLGLVMEACAKLGIEVVVLDRPNPLGGLKVEGCYVEQPFNSFVSQYRIPFLYGLTPGELAMLINEEGLNRGQKGDQEPVKCDLKVIPMEGWTRDMLYEDTGLPWVLPSPNIPYAQTARYYACSGMCGEIYNYLQVGVSYTFPFQVFGAAWIDPAKLLSVLQSYDLPGVKFRTIYFKPFAGSAAGKLLGGVQPFFTDWEKARPTEVQFYVIQALAQLYPTHLPFGPEERVGLFNKVCGTDFIKNTLSRTYRVDDILEYWRKDEEDFKFLRAKYLLY